MCKTTGQYNKFKLTQIQSSKRMCMSYAVKGIRDNMKCFCQTLFTRYKYNVLI